MLRRIADCATPHRVALRGYHRLAVIAAIMRPTGHPPKGPTSAPFIVTGAARVDAVRLCSTCACPDGAGYEGCQEMFKIGDTRYGSRVDGLARNVFHRLVP